MIPSSSQRPLTHFQTFARLHEAQAADINALDALSAKLPIAANGLRPNWSALMADNAAFVLVATECHLVVGAIAFVWDESRPCANLAWLGVEDGARGRGIGRLLLETALRELGAKITEMTAGLPPEAEALSGLLENAGFVVVSPGRLRVFQHLAAPASSSINI